MSVFSARFVAAVALGIAAALASCGDGGGPADGGPAPPEASADTECAELAGRPPARNRLDRGPGDGPPYGFNDHAGLSGTIPIAEDADLQARAGSSLWRVAIDWRFAEPEPGETSLETFDAIYCEALARGIRPIFHITGAPEWAADPGECPVPSCIDPPRESTLGDLSEFAELVARRYPYAAAIEAWNEPNLATFWTQPDPERYVDVLAAIHDGVKAATPAMPVLGGSLSNTARTDETRVGFARFLETMYRAGAARYMDALAFHPYPLEPLGSPGERFTGSMAEVRGLAREPIWVTEVGLPVGEAITADDQATTIRGVYRRLSRDPRVRAVVFHTLVEASGEAGGGDGFGWIARGPEGSLEPRPVYEAFASP